MFKKIRDFPKVLYNRMANTVYVGLGCFIMGTAYYFYAHDRITVFLSGAVLLFSLWRAYDIYLNMSKEKYEVVEGICVGVSAKPLSKYNKVRFMNQDGIESTVHLGKQIKMKIGFQYRLFFSQREYVSTGSMRLDTALLSGNFFGLEELGEYGAEQTTSDETE